MGGSGEVEEKEFLVETEPRQKQGDRNRTDGSSFEAVAYPAVYRSPLLQVC